MLKASHSKCRRLQNLENYWKSVEWYILQCENIFRFVFFFMKVYSLILPSLLVMYYQGGYFGAISPTALFFGKWFLDVFLFLFILPWFGFFFLLACISHRWVLLQWHYCDSRATTDVHTMNKKNVFGWVLVIVEKLSACTFIGIPYSP